MRTSIEICYLQDPDRIVGAMRSNPVRVILLGATQDRHRREQVTQLRPALVEIHRALQVQPKLRTGVEHVAKPQRHFGRDGALAINDLADR